MTKNNNTNQSKNWIDFVIPKESAAADRPGPYYVDFSLESMETLSGRGAIAANAKILAKSAGISFEEAINQMADERIGSWYSWKEEGEKW
jgi:hypothetical protein